MPCDLRVITTNGYVAKDGRAVMGRGCAREARCFFPNLDYKLGRMIREHGNRTMRLGRYDGIDLCSLPVKHHWRENAELELIERSVTQLVEIVDKFSYERVVMPRPGCGNGGLEWSTVKPLIEPLLNGRFIVVRYNDERY